MDDALDDAAPPPPVAPPPLELEAVVPLVAFALDDATVAPPLPPEDAALDAAVEDARDEEAPPALDEGVVTALSAPHATTPRTQRYEANRPIGTA